MKKFWIILLVCALLITAGCSKKADSVPETTEATAEATLPPETTEATIPVPNTVLGTAVVDGTPALLKIASRGEQMDVVGKYDEDHYAVKLQNGYGLVRKEFLRMNSEPAYEAWTGYARWNTEFYTDLFLSGEPAQKLKTNTKVTVLEDFGYCYLVQLEETVGFAKPEDISRWASSSGSSDDDGDSGSGSSGGGSSGGGNSFVGEDGGDISLQYSVGIQLLSAIEQSGSVTGTGTILADGTEVILGYFQRGDYVPVVQEAGYAESKAGFHTVYLDGLYAYVKEALVRTPDAENTYEEWTGYSRWSAPVYGDFRLLGSPVDKLNTNAKVQVLYELDRCYMVQIGETIGFMEKEMVNNAPYSSGGSSNDGGSGSGSSSSGGSSSGGGSSGGSSSGGGSSSSGSNDNVEWSPPAL